MKANRKWAWVWFFVLMVVVVVLQAEYSPWWGFGVLIMASAVFGRIQEGEGR